jgi:hypothetical protein
MELESCVQVGRSSNLEAKPGSNQIQDKKKRTRKEAGLDVEKGKGKSGIWNVRPRMDQLQRAVHGTSAADSTRAIASREGIQAAIAAADRVLRGGPVAAAIWVAGKLKYRVCCGLAAGLLQTLSPLLVQVTFGAAACFC